MKLYFIKVKNSELYVKVLSEMPLQIVLSTKKYASPFFENHKGFIQKVINDFKNQKIADLEIVEFSESGSFSSFDTSEKK